MIKNKIYIFILLLLIQLSVTGQNHKQRFESIDVQHYDFEIHLNDTTKKIEGTTTVSIKFLKAVDSFYFDLTNEDSDKSGMTVHTVFCKNIKTEFAQKENKLIIRLNNSTKTDRTYEFKIHYSGIPKDGLIISETRYGERTFFGDNWPDRARNWLPTIDHPSDKATFDFLVFAPKHYKVVSNGILIEEQDLLNEIKLSHWSEKVPISTKLMVIGVANFEIGNIEYYDTTQVSSWVFPQNKEKGFENYKYGTKALDYFSKLIGPFPFEKLAHVQSKTKYGGMENAGCIFYSKGTGYTTNSLEQLFAHETAHQWFGNSVTEQNWHHVWLSEGFATYLTHIYKQHFFGDVDFKNGLKDDRQRIIKFAKKKRIPVIDTTITNYNQLLNANSYQKASWFLHMLREKIGDDLFFKGLRKYYSDFKDLTALTNDFKNVMEEVSGNELDSFFKQWLWQCGHPVLNLAWKQEKEKIQVSINQTQKQFIFDFKMEIAIQYKNGDFEIVLIDIDKRKTDFVFSTDNEVENVIFDPEVKLLFEKNTSNFVPSTDY